MALTHYPSYPSLEFIRSFAIRFVITSETPIKFNVCKHNTDCDELKTFESSMEWFFVYPIAFYAAHMLLYNFWVWVVPHPKLHRRKNYCNTFIKAMSGGERGRLAGRAAGGGWRVAGWPRVRDRVNSTIPLTQRARSRMFAGFGNYLVRIISCAGKRWALWVYNLIQVSERKEGGGGRN